MIPVSLITGFLGSGKTTFLRQLAERYQDRRIVYLVNEFSPIDVDGELLNRETGDVLTLPGGSIFCTCLVTEFVRVLGEIPERFGAERGIEGVVIEASGVANPKVVERMLEETGLNEVYTLASIVSIADPASFLPLTQSLPNIIAQVESSDLILLNKTDTAPEEQIEATEAALRKINPGGEIIRTSFCRVDAELFAEARERRLEGEYAKCVDPNYARLNVRLEGELDLGRFRDAILCMGEGVYRIKGFTRVHGAMHYLDYSRAGMSVRRTEEVGEERLAMIFSGSAFARGREFVQAIKNGEYYEDGRD